MSDIKAPIDATATPEWAALQAHHDELVASGFHLKDAFASDPDRVGKLSFDMDDLHFDLSKNLVTEKTLGLLCDLARAVGLEKRRDAMRVVWCAFFALVIAAVGVSRIYLGVHYASDVLAGFCASLAWLAFYTKAVAPLFVAADAPRRTAEGA